MRKPPRSLLLRRNIFRFAFVAVALCVGVLAISQYGNADANAQQQAAPPPTPVTVQTVAPEPVRLWSQFSGKLVAVDAAEIRPEVSGRITEIRFQDGQQVKAGDVLMVIDPRPYEAALAKAEAELQSAQTHAVFAQKEAERAQKLVRTNVIPKRLRDERLSARDMANAAVASARAQAQQARLDVEHAYVKAPISGQVGRAEITVGNVVEADNSARLLTTIVSRDAMYADFEVDEKTYLQAIRGIGNDVRGVRAIPVKLTLRGDASHTYDGFIHAFDNQISGSSGTIRARALFANSDGSLMVGMFASVEMGSNGTDESILIPERAISTDQSKKFVYIVGEGNKVAYREVMLGAAMQGKRVIISGLSAGEKVIVDGLQHIRPDAVVEPKEEQQSPAS
jgi:membrane fusion protein, multidrug efflux system